MDTSGIILRDHLGAGINLTQDVLAILSEAQDGVFGVGSDQKIVFWNRSAELILGRSSSEMLGSFCYEAFSSSISERGSVCQPNCSTISLARKLKVDSAYNIRVDTEHDGPKWLSVTHVVVPSIKKDLGALIHIFHDVSREMKAIDLVTQLKGWVPPKSTNSAMTPATSAEQHEDLTQREQDVLRLLASGFNTAQVANKLVITPTTTRNHIQRILSKLGVHSRLEAVVTGARLGIL